MSIYNEKIPLLNNSTYIIRRFEIPYIDFPVHMHPEFEINFVTNAKGVRIVGDSIKNFETHDLVMTGPYLPHQWKTNEETHFSKEKSEQVVIQFHQEFMGKDFLERKETAQIKTLIEKSKRGILFGKKTVQKAAKLLRELLKLEEFNGLLHFFRLLDLLANSTDSHMLASVDFSVNRRNTYHKDKINPIFDYLQSHFTENIKMQDVARKFNMSASAFCHYIRKKTAKSFTQLLNELRIAYSCKLLINTDENIARICYRSGYNNLSYFNKRFKQFKGITPKQFRAKYH